MIFGHHHNAQEGPKCPKTGNLEDLWHVARFLKTGAYLSFSEVS